MSRPSPGREPALSFAEGSPRSAGEGAGVPLNTIALTLYSGFLAIILMSNGKGASKNPFSIPPPLEEQTRRGFRGWRDGS